MADKLKMPTGQGSQILTPEEQMILDRLCRLAAEGKEEVDAETIALAEKHLKWSFDDPASLERAAYFMAHDPFMIREVRAINEEFACTEGDGLEDY
jgi:hypothetical protein